MNRHFITTSAKAYPMQMTVVELMLLIPTRDLLLWYHKLYRIREDSQAEWFTVQIDTFTNFLQNFGWLKLERTLILRILISVLYLNFECCSVLKMRILEAPEFFVTLGLMVVWF